MQFQYDASPPGVFRPNLDFQTNITGQYGGKLRHEISPWCGMVLVLELELVLDLVSENLC